MNTAELRRSWTLMDWTERAVLVFRAASASMLNGIGFAGSAYLTDHIAHGHHMPEIRSLLSALVCGALLGLFLFLSKPGLKS